MTSVPMRRLTGDEPPEHAWMTSMWSEQVVRVVATSCKFLKKVVINDSTTGGHYVGFLRYFSHKKRILYRPALFDFYRRTPEMNPEHEVEIENAILAFCLEYPSYHELLERLRYLSDTVRVTGIRTYQIKAPDEWVIRNIHLLTQQE